MRKHTEKELKAVLEAHRRWVATEGKAVAAAMKSVCITAGAESGEPGGDDIIGAIDEAESALHAVRSVCDLRGWKP